MWWWNKDLMELTLLLVLIRVILNGTEALARSREYATAGLFSWPLKRARYSWLAHGMLADVIDAGLRHPRYLYLVTMQMLCAAALLLPVARPAAAPLLLFILAVELFSPIRNGGYGMEGSDQMHLILLFAINIYFAVSDPFARTAVVWFIALQSMLAYFTSGVVKLRTRPWKAGDAIRLVLSTENYGCRRMAQWLNHLPNLSKWMCWGVVAFECLFPLVVLAGPRVTLPLLICGAGFHLMIAGTMGLNGFFWSFVATYPAIYKFSSDFQQLLHSSAIPG
jgi:uncharacterized membrane protein YphA (DoxX/SURF4 family)